MQDWVYLVLTVPQFPDGWKVERVNGEIQPRWQDTPARDIHEILNEWGTRDWELASWQGRYLIFKRREWHHPPGWLAQALSEPRHLEQSCHTCRSLSGEARISPGPPVYAGRYWVVEHAYPCARLGWLVMVLRRHAEALHDLAVEEWVEFGDLQRRTVETLAAETGCAKEYMALFAEKPGFRHLHQHIVAVPADLPAELRGTKIFAWINPVPTDVVPPAELAAFCARLASAFAAP